MDRSWGRHTSRCDAILLNTTAYGESDLILHLLSSEIGLFKGFARAARKSVKRFGGSLSLFSTSAVYHKEGGGDLKLITEAESLVARNSIGRDLAGYATASYGIELVEMLLVPEEPAADVFSLLTGFLDFLDRQGDAESARLLFELRLVEILGYLPHLLHCSACFSTFSGKQIVNFDVGRGGALCSACADDHAISVGLGTLGSLAKCLRGGYGVFAGFRLSPQTLMEAGPLLDQIYRSILPREPKSLKFMGQLDGSRS